MDVFKSGRELTIAVMLLPFCLWFCLNYYTSKVDQTMITSSKSGTSFLSYR